MTVTDAQIRDLMRRALPPAEESTSLGSVEKVDQRNEGAQSPRYARHSESEYISTFQVVQKASEAIDNLQERYRRLDAEMRESNERFRKELVEAQTVIKDWERLASGLKAQLQRSEANGAELQQRLSAAETRTESLERELKASEGRLLASQARAREAEKRAKTAEELATEEIKLATSLREKISETFNPGRLSSALMADPEG